MEGTLLRAATILDGTGAPPFLGNVLVSGNRIQATGPFEPPLECKMIDCEGLTVAPGFIDVHSHSDLQVLENRREKLEQGVTTEVVGNCGFSAYPCGSNKAVIQGFANGIFNGGSNWGWSSAREYLDEIKRRAKLANVLSLVGHGSLRLAVAGNRQGPLTTTELDLMAQVLSDALSEGACGLSSGLMYAPGSCAPFDELLCLCRVVANYDKIYTTHMRSYAQGLLKSVDEQLELSRQSGCRLQISHLQAVGRCNWEKQDRAVEKIEDAFREGIDVAFDIYPYLAGSTIITQLLPQWALEGGIDGLLGRLECSTERQAIAAEVRDQTPHSWSDIVIASMGSGTDDSLVGKTLAEVAASRDEDPLDTMLQLIAEVRGAINIIASNQSEKNLRNLLVHPLCLVISDGVYAQGRPHPRLYGTFPKLLGEVCREKRWLTLAGAVHKITQQPASRFAIHNRGVIAPGSLADLTVFDADEISSPASYEDPKRLPKGIRMVFREGLLLARAS